MRRFREIGVPQIPDAIHKALTGNQGYGGRELTPDEEREADAAIAAARERLMALRLADKLDDNEGKSQYRTPRHYVGMKDIYGAVRCV